MLIPKLKAGFLIQSTVFLIQTMILFVYPAKAIYRNLLDSRIGTKAPNEEIRKLMAR